MSADYCSAKDVEAILTAYASELQGSGGYTSAAIYRRRITELLPIGKAVVDDLAGRDFNWYSAATLTVDGDGLSYILDLGAMGYSPVTAITSITENGSTVALADICGSVSGSTLSLNADDQRMGRIRKQASGTYVAGAAWSKGVGNIVLGLSYGYEFSRTQVPDIVRAQALVVAAYMVGGVRGAGTGGIKSRSIGNYTVAYGSDNAHQQAQSAWLDEVEATCQRYRRSWVGGVG